MRLIRGAIIGLIVLGTGACYHATVNTGLAPSSTVIRKEWAHSFLYGLVPPNVVDAAKACPSGVARVETQHSFLNMLANFITFGLYSPMEIDVTCASGSSGAGSQGDAAIEIQRDASPEQMTQSFHEATQRAVETQRAVYVRFK
jgi:Bor protein